MNRGDHSKRDESMAATACLCFAAPLGLLGIYLLCHYASALFILVQK